LFPPKGAFSLAQEIGGRGGLQSNARLPLHLLLTAGDLTFIEVFDRSPHLTSPPCLTRALIDDSFHRDDAAGASICGNEVRGNNVQILVSRRGRRIVIGQMKGWLEPVAGRPP
jgi:hypothetical protein